MDLSFQRRGSSSGALVCEDLDDRPSLLAIYTDTERICLLRVLTMFRRKAGDSLQRNP
jgi:hypothetical protein